MNGESESYGPGNSAATGSLSLTPSFVLEFPSTPGVVPVWQNYAPKTSNIHHPSNCVLIFEGNSINVRNQSAAALRWLPAHNNNTMTNLLFCDGHAESIGVNNSNVTGNANSTLNLFPGNQNSADWFTNK